MQSIINKLSFFNGKFKENVCENNYKGIMRTMSRLQFIIEGQWTHS